MSNQETLILAGVGVLGAIILLRPSAFGDLFKGVSSGFISGVGEGFEELIDYDGDTVGIGEPARRNGQCDLSGVGKKATDPDRRPAKLGDFIGECNGVCAFKRLNYQGNYRCFDNCRTCALCKFGSNSSKPCKKTPQQIAWETAHKNRGLPR